MYKSLKKYSDENPERFNRAFLESRKRQDILSAVREIFDSFEIISEVKVESVTLETDEASFGPIKLAREYYKSVLPSRTEKIHYKLRISPTDGEESFIKEGDLFIPKLVDDYFYINEGVRYFLIHQIVDNATYANKDSVSLKLLAMPMTIERAMINVAPVYGDETFEVPLYKILLFKKCLTPLFYTMLPKAVQLLEEMPVSDPDNIIVERSLYRSTEMIDIINSFYGVNFKFSDSPDEVYAEDRYVFRSIGADEDGLYFSVPKEEFENNHLAKFLVGAFSELRSEYYSNSKKKRVSIKYDDLISPNFWVDFIAGFFTKNADPLKRYEKSKAILLSLDRLIDSATKKILRISERDKETSLTVIRYILAHFEALNKEDPCNLDTKRVRVLEYMLYPLRTYVSNQIYRVLNSQSRNRALLSKMLTGLNPMYLIKNIVQNELLRYYNSSNDAMTLYSAITKYSMKGPQALSSFVHTAQRDVHPSYTGRISLVASNAATPGLSGTLVPFLELYDDYFAKPEEE